MARPLLVRADWALSAGVPEKKDRNGWHDPKPLRQLVRRLVGIMGEPHAHFQDWPHGIGICCSRRDGPLPALDAAHFLYAWSRRDEPRYADGYDPEDPPWPLINLHRGETEEGRWRRHALARVLEIAANREAHHHLGLGGLNDCCTVDGFFDWTLLVAHDACATLGRNPAQPCDALEGPCACGATHQWGKPR